jgi:oligopeptidase B
MIKLASSLAALAGGLLLMGAADAPSPPVAPVKDHVQVWHGEQVVDPYFWLREKGSPEVVKYLEAENGYTAAMTAAEKPFADALYAELLGRIKQTDLSVPVRRGRFHYYSRTVEGLPQGGGARRELPRGFEGGGAARPERDGQGAEVPLRRRLRRERR